MVDVGGSQRRFCGYWWVKAIELGREVGFGSAECCVWVREEVAFRGEGWERTLAWVVWEVGWKAIWGRVGENEWRLRWASGWRWMWVAPRKFPGQSWDKDCSVWMGGGLQRPEGVALGSPSQKE